MKSIKNIVLLIFTPLLLLTVSGCGRKHSQDITQNLVSVWQFRKTSDTVWYPAKVPGTVQTDLLRNKLIPDPFYGTNESKLQWIGKENWIYKTRFDIADSIFRENHIELIFNGLDTYAEVRLNGRLILNADNMFRTWKVDCKKILRKNGNTLTILFRSPLKVNKARFERMPYRLPAENDISDIKVSVFTRKAPYQFGWDWAPRFVTCGIWRPVKITAWDNAKINDLQIYQQNVC